MWTIKFFGCADHMYKWIYNNCHKYQYEIVYVNNGYAVEYRPLRKVY